MMEYRQLKLQKVIIVKYFKTLTQQNKTYVSCIFLITQFAAIIFKYTDEKKTKKTMHY